jgi:hypothetical protein
VSRTVRRSAAQHKPEQERERRDQDYRTDGPRREQRDQRDLARDGWSTVSIGRICGC